MFVSAKVELACIVAFYTWILWTQTRITVPRYGKVFGRSTKLPLLVHILSGLFEVFRYHLRALRGPVAPDAIDLLAGVLQASTSLMLAKHARMGRPTVTRPTYQAGGLLRLVVTVVAFANQDAGLHRSSVKMLNAFVYTRLDIWILNRLGIFRSYADKYAFAMTHGAAQAVYEGGLRHGVKMYLGGIAAVMLLNWLVSQYIEERHSGPSEQPQQSMLESLMVYLGFADLKIIRRSRDNARNSFKLTDEYIGSYLSSLRLRS